MNEARDKVRNRARRHFLSPRKKKVLFKCNELLLMGLETLTPKGEHRLWEALSLVESPLCYAYEMKELLRAIYAGQSPFGQYLKVGVKIVEGEGDGELSGQGDMFDGGFIGGGDLIGDLFGFEFDVEVFVEVG